VKVLLAVALPDRQALIELQLAEGSTVAQAIVAGNLGTRFAGLDVSAMRTGVWSRACARETVLREGDRVELYRPLVADAKQMRRERAKDKGPGR
jgi:putative ubiquitin-RnfH superfamily antitoxin RatB of RatAB toxin-antitoxin module